MYIQAGVENYRNTGIMLLVYKSLRGTSKCEAIHSFLASKSVDFNNVSCAYFDVKILWLITNFNRRRLAELGVETLPENASPSECVNFTRMSNVPKNELPLIGTKYCRQVVADFEESNTAYIHCNGQEFILKSG